MTMLSLTFKVTRFVMVSLSNHGTRSRTGKGAPDARNESKKQKQSYIETEDYQQPKKG